MERATEIKGKASSSRSPDHVLKKRKHAKLEAAGVGIAKRPTKPEKKAKGPDAAVGVMMASAGSSEEEQAEAGKMRNKEKRREPEEAEGAMMTMLDAGSSEKRGEKLVGRRVSRQQYTEDFVVNEVVSYLLSAPSPLSFTNYMESVGAFGYPLGLRVAAYLNKGAEFNADLVRQYRTNGYSRIPSESEDCDGQEV